MRRSFDVLLLFLLLIARLRINSFAEASLFEHFQNVARHPLLGQLLPEGAIDAFGPWLGDPIFLILAAFSLLMFILYSIFDLLSDRLGETSTYRIKLGLLWLILAALVFLPTLKLIILRHDNLPQSYSHDGGVIQTEATIDYFLTGRNPYVEDYYDTPMAEWGFPEFRTALEHYPYLPATFIASAPVKLGSDLILGWYDQRFVYLILFIIILLLVPGLVKQRHADVLGLTMLLGLNPIMGLDVMFGQNDVFVLAWIVISVWFMQRQRFVWSAIFFGIACAAKPTAWFFAPFWGIAMLDQQELSWRVFPTYFGLLLKRISPAILVFLISILPYLFWNLDAFIDDVWRWASGTSEVHYQIWGWGFANFVMSTGILPDRFAYWPFWIPELIVTLPLFLILITRQLRHNTIASFFWHGALLLLIFAYFSRFLNENYLGFLLALFALGYYLSTPPDPSSLDPSHP